MTFHEVLPSTPTIARFKARWVMRDHLQQFGINFDQMFAAVVKPMAFRVLFAIAPYYDLDIDQMDVKMAFLFGMIDQMVYVQMPKDSETTANKGMVCKLLKALYGLKQAPRLWYKRLSKLLLEKLGLKRINSDHNIFVSQSGINEPIVSTFVDDIKLMGVKGSGHIEMVKRELAAAFERVDMGAISFCLGLKVERDWQKKTLKLSQPAYIDKILSKYYLDFAKPCNTPMKEAILLPNEGPEATKAEQERYQGMIRSMIFSMVETRPDITFATLVVSRFANNPSRQHTEAVKTIMRYLKATRTLVITYGKEEGGDLIIKGYSDSDWAGDHATRKSTSGFFFMLNGGPVSWCSKRQATVALSSTEAEYLALTLAAKVATWMRLLLTEVGLLDEEGQYAEIKVIQGSKETEQIKADPERQEEEVPSSPLISNATQAPKDDLLLSPTPLSSFSQASNSLSNSSLASNDLTPLSLKGDNQKSIALADNPVSHARTKHIDIQHH